MGDATDLDLYKLFSPFGAIAPTGVKVMMNPDGTSKGFGFADFLMAEDAATAVLALDNFTMSDGSSIQVQQKKPSLAKKGGGKAANGGEGLALANGKGDDDSMP